MERNFILFSISKWYFWALLAFSLWDFFNNPLGNYPTSFIIGSFLGTLAFPLAPVTIHYFIKRRKEKKREKKAQD